MPKAKKYTTQNARELQSLKKQLAEARGKIQILEAHVERREEALAAVFSGEPLSEHLMEALMQWVHHGFSDAHGWEGNVVLYLQLHNWKRDNPDGVIERIE